MLLGAGLAARAAAVYLRLPELLLFLAAGVAVGPSALDWADAPLESDAVQLLLTLGVSFILFHGGLELSARVLRRTWITLLLLVIPGVLITVAITGAVAAAAFGIPLLTGLLIGAVLAPTDPAILIPVFDRLRLRPRLEQTIVAESALTDPIGAVLALAIGAAVVGGSTSIAGPMSEFAVEVAVSTVIGIAFGVVLALVVSSRRAGIWQETPGLAVALVVAVSYASIDFAGGSGYLGAFLAGLILGNARELGLAMPETRERDLRIVVSAASDVVALLVFVVLGANLPLRAMWEELGPALLTVAALMLVARPIVIALCLLPDRRARWTREELIFFGWTRETGVLPAALVGVLAAMGVREDDLLAVCVAVAIVATLTLQTATKPWLARRLNLQEDPEPQLP